MWIYLGVIVGAICRALLPYLQERADSDEPLQWDWKYVVGPALNVVISLFAVPLAIAEMPVDIPDFFAAFAFIWGWGGSDLLRYVQKGLWS